MQKVGPVTVFSSVIWQTTSTVIECEKRIFVFDPAYFPLELARIEQFVKQIQNNRPITLVLTHGDWDHIAGFNHFHDSTVVAHESILNEGRLENQVGKAKKFDGDYYVHREVELGIPRIDHAVPEIGGLLSEGVQYFSVNGHTDDMIATHFQEQKILVVGDMLSNLEFPFIYHDSSEYLDSLSKVKALIYNNQVDLLIPGHGAITTNQAEMMQRVEQDVHYIESLRSLVFEQVARGKDQEQMISSLLNFSYAGQSIHPFLMERHQDNIEQLIREAKES